MHDKISVSSHSEKRKSTFDFQPVERFSPDELGH